MVTMFSQQGRSGVHGIPGDAARRLRALARLLQGQTPDSRWVGESERCLQKSGKKRERGGICHCIMN